MNTTGHALRNTLRENISNQVTFNESGKTKKLEKFGKLVKCDPR